MFYHSAPQYHVPLAASPYASPGVAYPASVSHSVTHAYPSPIASTPMGMPYAPAPAHTPSVTTSYASSYARSPAPVTSYPTVSPNYPAVHVSAEPPEEPVTVTERVTADAMPDGTIATYHMAMAAFDRMPFKSLSRPKSKPRTPAASVTRAPQPVYEQPSSSRRSSVRPAPAPAPRPVVPPVQAPPRLTAEQELMMQMAETCCDEYGNPLTPRTHMAVLAFLAFDANMSGEVDVYEFHAALTHMGLPYTLEDAAALFMMMDKDGSGTMSISEFLVYCQQHISARGQQLTQRSLPPPSDLQLAARDMFRAFDADMTGWLGVEQFRDAMEELGIPMDVEEAATLFSMVDENGYGIMEEEEFVEHVMQIGAPQQFEGPGDGEYVEDALSGKAHKSFRNVSKTRLTGDVYQDAETLFIKHDAERSGYLDVFQFMAALRDAGLGLSYTEAEQRFSSTGPNGEPMMTLEEFTEHFAAESGVDIEPQGASSAFGTWAPEPMMDMEHAGAAEVFRTYDLDGDGALDVFEYMAAMLDLGLGRNYNDALSGFSHLDEDENGFMSLEEFTRHYNRRG